MLFLSSRTCSSATAAIITLIISFLVASINGKSVSVLMKGNEEKSCYYFLVSPDNSGPNMPLNIVFAVTDAQTMNSATVNSEVYFPDHPSKVQYEQKSQAYREISIQNTIPGEYALCLSHDHSSYRDKNVDIDVNYPAVSVAAAAAASANGDGLAVTEESASKLEQSIINLQNELQGILSTMKYLKARESNNLSTVKAIEKWIYRISIFEILLIVSMSALQVSTLRFFFSKAGKQRV